MNVRMACFAMVFVLGGIGAKAQTAEPAAKPAREVAPDQKAYQDAVKITDPQQKVEALEKFKKDFPESAMAGSATMNIFSTLVQKMPDQTARIQQFADTTFRAAEKKDKGRVAGQMADTLLSNNLLLHDAERYARKSLDALDQAEYIKEQKASFAKRKATVPADEELVKRFRQSRAVRVGVLGRIEFKLGKNGAAQKLLDESYGVTPTAPAVSGALGELAWKTGNEAKALDYLIPTRLSGRAPATSAAALETIYRKNHGGSLDGFEAMLDAEYQKRFPSPIKPEVLKKVEGRTDRLVLAEVFTGAGCGPCVGADLAFEAAMERYPRTDLAVVMYHQHIPQPDPMTNPDTAARYKYYSPQGVPTYKVDGGAVMCVEDGKPVECSGDNRDGAKDIYGHVQIAVDRELVALPQIQLRARAVLEGHHVVVTGQAYGPASNFTDVTVQVLLLEKQLRYSGENGIRFHPMVVRAIGGEKGGGFLLPPGGADSFQQGFDLDQISADLKKYLDEYEAKPARGNPFQFIEKKDQIDRGNLAVVVFAQDTKTKKVLQAAFVDLNPQPAHAATESK